MKNAVELTIKENNVTIIIKRRVRSGLALTIICAACGIPNPPIKAPREERE